MHQKFEARISLPQKPQPPSIKMMRVFIFTFCIVLFLGVLLPIVPTDAQRDEATVAANWTFNDGSAKDSSKKGVNGNFAGKPQAVDGIAGKALKFNGKSDGTTSA